MKSEFKVFLAVASVVVMSALVGCGDLPEKPTGLTATSKSPVTLSWNTVSNAKTYSVFRSHSSSRIESKTSLASGITGTTYTDLTALAGSTFFYQVKAHNQDGVSVPSDEISVTSTYVKP